MKDDVDDSETNEQHRLEWRDLVALTVATLQTVLLPFLVAIAIFLILLFIIRR